MRQTELTTDKSGAYYRNLGFAVTKSGTLSQPKFLLGTNRKEAAERLAKLQKLWTTIAAGGSKKWGKFELAIDKAIANGDSEFIVERSQSVQDNVYAHIVGNLAQSFGNIIRIVPEDGGAFEAGRSFNETFVSELDVSGEEVKGIAKELAAIMAVSFKQSGPSLHQALSAYQESIKGMVDPSDGMPTDNAVVKIRQCRTLATVLPDVAIASLDIVGCENLFNILRNRPKSKRYQTPMKRKSCQNYIGELARFFTWLHRNTNYAWRKPEDFADIRKDVITIEADSEYKEVFTYSVDQLRTIVQYATPVERLFVLLGLNCAFGADQAGRLKVGEIKQGKKHQFIKRIRHKKQTLSWHVCWNMTTKALQWAAKQRKSNKPNDPFLTTDSGKAYYHRTKGGQRCQTLPNMWNRLLKRIRKDHEKFPMTGFNVLRDTAADMIHQLSTGEIASTMLAHRYTTKDELLPRYSNPVFKQLWKAELKLERKLQPMFAAGGDDPFADRPKQYTTNKTIERMVEMDEDGTPVAAIAKALDVSHMTVYRHLKGRAKPVKAKLVKPVEPITFWEPENKNDCVSPFE